MTILTLRQRLRILLISIVLVTVILIARVIYLASVPVEDYKILEKGEYTIRRGDITDRNGRLLAISDELKSVYVNPNDIKNKESAAQKLAPVLNIPYETLYNLLNQRKNFVWLKRQIPPATAEKVINLHIHGIFLTSEYKRLYPNNNLASHILGFCNIDGRGVEGIEKNMDTFLLADAVASKNIDEGSISDKGYNVELTLDSVLQSIAEKNLDSHRLKQSADAVSFILLDGLTGEVLVMANSPDFNPNYFGSYTQKDYRNTAIFNQYEPGSVFKIFSVAALLESGKVNNNDIFFCDGVYEKDGEKVRCTGVHGAVTISGIFKYSCNDATLQAASYVSDYEMYHYLKAFGFGETTTIMLPGEQPGILRNIDKWSGRSMLAIPIGQEVAVNSLQMVRAATVFINKGIMLEPFIIKRIYDNNNKNIKIFERLEVRKVISSRVSEIILNGMKSAVTKGGTVQYLSVEGIDFAAKSGTAQIFSSELGGYSDDDFTSSLLVIFPASKPRYVSYIVFHKPKGEISWGGVIGAYYLNDFLSEITGYLSIKEKDALIYEKDIVIKEDFRAIKKLPSAMPDLIGMIPGEAVSFFKNVNIKVEVEGTGKVIRQYPDVGTMLNEGDQVILRCR